MTKNIIGNHIIHLEEVDSTNTYALELIRTNRLPEGTVISTYHQTHGKGLDTNTWESEPYKNIAFTIILYPSFLSPDNQFELNKIFSLGVCDLIQKLLPHQEVTIKWPNDIYVNDRKICGMLIQNSILGDHFDYIIAGIGINVNQENFSPGLPNPVSLKNLSGKDYDLEEILGECCRTLNNRYNQLIRSEFEQIDSDYLNVLFRSHEWHYFEIKGKVIKARITGINRYGMLKLATEPGIQYECELKEVQFIL